MKAKSNFFIYLLPLAVCLLYFFFGFWKIPLFPPDEPKYTFAALKMLETGDYLTPYFNCEVRLEKPIFTYWAIVASYKFFGVSDWAARLPVVLFMSALIYFIFFMVRNEFNEKVAIYSTLFFATNFQIYLYSKAIVPEPFLLVFNTISTFCFYSGIKRNNNKYIFWGYVFSGLAFLTKGPLGVIIPFGINIPFFFIRKNLKDLSKNLFNLPGISAFLAINFWYFFMFKLHGMNFVNEFFIMHNLKRFSGGASMHIYPFYYYLPVVLISLSFWLPFLPNFARYLKEPKLNETEKFLCWWAVFVFLLFSLSKNKLHHYIIIMHPPLAILMALAYQKIRGEKLFSNIIIFLMIICELLLLIFSEKFTVGFDYDLILVLITLPFFTLILLVINNFLGKHITFYFNLLFFLIFSMFITSYAAFIKQQSIPQYTIIKNFMKDKKLYSYKRNSEDINFYVNTCTEKLDSIDDVEKKLKTEKNVLLIVHEKHLPELTNLKYKILAKTITLKNISWFAIQIF